MQAKCHGKVGQPSLLPCMLLLAVFFLVGVSLGQFLIRLVPPEVGQELTEYMEAYVGIEADQSIRACLTAAFLYFRYPLFVVLFGFSALGIVLIPGATLLFGFLSSFSVSCFTAAFGAKGVWLALAAYGIRCAVTLPCYFVLAVPALIHSIRLTSLLFGRGRRVLPVVYGRIWWIRIAVCSFVLILGVCIDLMLSPVLLHLALDQMFIF